MNGLKIILKVERVIYVYGLRLDGMDLVYVGKYWFFVFWVGIYLLNFVRMWIDIWDGNVFNKNKRSLVFRF